MESLRLPERLRLGLTAGALVVTILAGWQLWRGSANPLVYRSGEQKQRSQWQRLARDLPGALAGGTLVSEDANQANVDFASPAPPLRQIRVVLLYTGSLLNAEHTQSWAKRGYEVVEQPPAIARTRCEHLIKGAEHRALLSYYLSASEQYPDFAAIQQLLLSRRLGACRSEWLLRVELPFDGNCQTTKTIAPLQADLTGHLQNWLKKAAKDF